MTKKKIVLIGGGTGTAAVARSLKSASVHISIIHTPADDGGSGGDMRRAFDIIAPGDARAGLLALSESKDKSLLNFFAHRYQSGPLKGQVVGNLMLAGLTLTTGSFEQAITAMKEMLQVKGEIMPASLKKPTLYAELENGKVIKGETNIYLPKYNPNLHIKKVWLRPGVPLNPRAKQAIADADLIILGPGSFYSSVLPNLLVSGMTKALKQAQGTIAFVINSVNQPGQTVGFKPSDYITVMEEYAGQGVIDVATLQDKNLAKNLKRLL